MKIRKNHHKSILALLLIAALTGNMSAASLTYAQEFAEAGAEEAGDSEGENPSEETAVQSEEASEEESADFSEAQEENGEESSGTDPEDADPEETDVLQPEASEPKENTAEAEEIQELQQEDSFSEKADTQSEFDDGEELVLSAGGGETSELPFTMSVTFEGNTLPVVTESTGSAENNSTETDQTEEETSGETATGTTEESATETIADNWSSGTSKTVTVQVNRNNAVSADNTKKYVLCMKVSNVFYFNGIPDAGKINGVDQAAILKNATPVVNTSNGDEQDLTNFSPYSGEIRLLLNPSVDTITVSGVGISFNTVLAGYTGGTQTITGDPIQFSLKAVDQNANLAAEFSSDTTNVLQKCAVNSANLKTGSLKNTNMKQTLSTDGFATDGVNEQSVKLGKDASISYAGGTAGQNVQVYQSLQIKFHCPYIKVGENKTRYYLAFSTDDTALSANKQGKKTGYKMPSAAVYDESEHTITYSFKNIYIGGHTSLFYTPKFSWPLELENEAVDQNYKIEGVSWEITEQKTYTGQDASLNNSYTPGKYFGYFIPEGVDIVMTSSALALDDQKIAKREIYQGLTRENGTTGTLGFFDIHNEGTQDSPDLNIQFEFNTQSSDTAKYYVTRVNLPLYLGTGSVTVNYVLEDADNPAQTVKGTYTQTVGTTTEIFACNVSNLCSSSNVGSTYFIKSLSYTTKLKKGKNYHAETAHLYRNREADSGLFFGYLEGELNATAHATMTIASGDNTAIGKDTQGKEAAEISSTECSTVSDQDYVGYSLSKLKIDGNDSQSVVAGNSATLSFTGTVSTEEYPMPGTTEVNGYHILRNAVLYVALPEDVSISGKSQVKVTVNKQNFAAEDPQQLTGTSFTVNGKKAVWWQIRVPNMNVSGGQTFEVSIQLATNLAMREITWNFANAVAVRAEEQSVSWGAAGSANNTYNTVSALNKYNGNSQGAVSALSTYFATEIYKDKLGLNLFHSGNNVALTISRAEAKLDVTTELTTSEKSEAAAAATVSSADSDIHYLVNISSDDGGAAEDFSYYIPVVKKATKLDTGALVTGAEYSLDLSEAVTITEKTENENGTGSSPFQVQYTTEKNLTSTTIRADTLKWKDSVSDCSEVTAVKISTSAGAVVAAGASYQFQLNLKYDNTGEDYDSMAGCVNGWRSFGRYTYRRNGSATTNSYPSGNNTVTLKYRSDSTSQPVTVNLSTAADSANPVSVEKKIDTKFSKKQELYIKKVEVSAGTQLVTTDPESLTGADANSKFWIKFGINSGTKTALTEKNSGTKTALTEKTGETSEKWTVASNGEIRLNTEVKFSKALTDSLTERTVTLTVGNDDIDIKYRIRLIRTVAPVSADGSGVAVGENYQVPTVSTEGCVISADSAFTALYVVNRFIPGNYSGQKIAWKQTEESGSIETAFPQGTRIVFMPLNSDSKAESYWYYQVTDKNTKSIDLSVFTQMSSNGIKYTYDKTSTNATALRYLLVVDFGGAQAAVGSYALAFEPQAKNGVLGTGEISLPVTVSGKSSYSLSASQKAASLTPETDITCTVAEAQGNDSYAEGRSLSLVLTPENGSGIPSDLRIRMGGKTYARNTKGTYIIPLGTIKTETCTLQLLSDMFPDTAADYCFSGQLYLANSSDAGSPMNGQSAGATAMVTFQKSAKPEPALKVTGTRIATVQQWSQGQYISIDYSKLPSDAALTATVYSGTTGTTKVTDILSGVDGKFDIKDGIGTYHAEGTSTGKLTLSGMAKSGTYRIVFEVKDGENKVLLTVPYYIIVQ